MVFDSLQNAARYAALSPLLARGFERLCQADLAALAPGDYPLDGERLILKIQQYNTRPAAEARPEAHRRYVDVQCVLSGSERIGVAPVDAMRREAEANPDGDIWFYEGETEAMTLHPGDFMILYPGEAHAPCIAVDTPQPVKKALLKIELSAL